MILAVFRVVGIMIFLYLLWRKLRDDYQDEELVSFTWVVLLSFLVVGRVSFGLENWGVWNDSWWRWILFWQNPGFNYLTGYLAIIASAFWFLRQKKWRVIAVLEDMIWPLMMLFLFIWIDEYVRSGWQFEVLRILPFLGFLAGLIWWGGGKYRSFEWYKSGKKGFVFWFANFVGWLLVFGFGFWAGWSWFWRITAIILSLISGVGLFILGDVLSELQIFQIKRRNTDDKEEE